MVDIVDPDMVKLRVVMEEGIRRVARPLIAKAIEDERERLANVVKKWAADEGKPGWGEELAKRVLGTYSDEDGFELGISTLGDIIPKNKP